MGHLGEATAARQVEKAFPEAIVAVEGVTTMLTEKCLEAPDIVGPREVNDFSAVPCHLFFTDNGEVISQRLGCFDLEDQSRLQSLNELRQILI